MLRPLTFLLCASALLAQTPAPTSAPAPAPTPADLDPARDLFGKQHEVVHFALTLEPAQRKQLAEKPREYVPCTVRVDGKLDWLKVGVKLKGAAGSFQQIDERPGFTLNLGKFGEAQRFFGLQRFHLNNGTQDESRLSEWLGGQVFTAAGYPAPRVAHARVSLDGKDLGLYVLREAFDKQFLLRVFGTTKGNLYDGGFCQDIDADLEKDSGEGPDDRSDLKQLRELCRAVDPERVPRLEQAIDVNALIDFCAIEAMLGHWDGYCQNRNNFRLWCASSGRAQFLPHGMDQLFGDADASVLRHPPGLVASAILQIPAWRKRYRERLKALLPLFAPQKLQVRIEAMAAAVRKEVHTIDPAAASAYDAAVQNLCERVAARYRSLQVQVKAPEPQPVLMPVDKPVALKKWVPAGETDFIELAKKSFQGVPAMLIGATKRADEARRGAWRTSLLLGRGHYRLTATARCENVEGYKEGDGTVHGGVRLAVGDARSEKLLGDQNWKPLTCEFEVTEFQREVELRLEFAALAGKSWFRADSVHITRLPD